MKKNKRIPTIHTDYNAFRAERGLPPVKRETVIRYIDAGSGYASGAPKLFKQYLKSRA